MTAFATSINRSNTACALLFAAAALLLTGCNASPAAKQPSAAKPDARRPTPQGESRITLTGDGLNLGEAGQPTLRPDTLVRTVAQLLAERRFASAQRWVHRYPDVALELLRGPVTTLDAAVLAFIAEQHDRQCSTHAAVGWAQVQQHRAANASAYAAFQNRRAQLLTAIRSGRLREAVAADLPAAVPAGAPGNLMRIEALRLHGIALLVDEQHEQAAAAFEQATQAARPDHPYQAAHLLLLAADARRRHGDEAAGAAHWTEAVVTGASLLRTAHPVQAPIFWERAAYLRPSDVAWPGELDAWFAHALTNDEQRTWQTSLPMRNTTAADGENAANADFTLCLLWSNVGLWRLSRQEPQSALLALQKAEILADRDALRHEVRLHQARALVKLRQHTAAMSLLVGLMDNPTAVGRSALATAGVMSLEQGQVRRGLSLLQRAVDSEQADAWPGQPQAEADLGLAYLIIGEHDKGLALLHDAQQSFERHSRELLIKALRNEQRYLLALDRGDEAKAIASRIRTLEAAPALAG